MNKSQIESIKKIDSLIESFFKESSFNEDKFVNLIININSIIEKIFSKEELEVFKSHIFVDLIEVTFNHYNLNKNDLMELFLTKFNIKYTDLLKKCLF